MLLSLFLKRAHVYVLADNVQTMQKEYFVAIYVSLDEINFQLLPWIFVITIDNTGMP